MDLGISIRPARPEHEEVVVSLWRRANLVGQSDDPSPDFRLALGRMNSEVLVAVSSDETIVGAVIVGHDGHRSWIYSLAADPDLRRQGIGGALVREAETWARQRGIPKLQFLVRDTNQQILPFYEGLGFERGAFVVMTKWL